ncbi:MAG: hypothetical protein ACI4V3_05505 [Faecousia sp.]
MKNPVRGGVWVPGEERVHVFLLQAVVNPLERWARWRGRWGKSLGGFFLWAAGKRNGGKPPRPDIPDFPGPCGAGILLVDLSEMWRNVKLRRLLFQPLNVQLPKKSVTL